MEKKLDKILDVSHWQGEIDFQKVADSGIVAVILKCDEGNGIIDKNYLTNLDKALKAGLMVGAYHFIRKDGITEAKTFIKNIHQDNLKNIILNLDFEVAIPISECEDFVNEIEEFTGKFPLFYINESGLNSGEISEDSILKKCPLWIARYGKDPVVPKELWDTWTIWQWTENGTCPGIKTACDRDCFNGSDVDQIKEFWNYPVPAVAIDGVTNEVETEPKEATVGSNQSDENELQEKI